MTVSDQTAFTRTLCNGVSGNFTFNHPFLTVNELKVTHQDAVTGVITEWAYITDYTISGTADANGFYPSGATIVAVVTPDADDVVTVERNSNLTQTADYDTADNFPAAIHEAALDKAYLIIQELKRLLTRAPKVAATSQYTELVFPDPEDGKAIVWDGTTLANSDSNIDTLAATVTAAVTAAQLAETNAETAETNAEAAEAAAEQALADLEAILNDGFVSVKSYGAVGDGVADDSQAFIDALAENRTVVVPPGTYELTGSIPVEGRLIGLGRPQLNISAAVSGDQGLYINTSGASIDGFSINRDIAGSVGDGTKGCAIVVGDGTTLVENWAIRNCHFTSSGGYVWNGITIFGNCADGIVENLSFDGAWLIPVQLHWAGIQNLGVYTETYHPRNIKISNVSVTDGDSTGYIVYLSAAHDVQVENVYGENISRGIVVAAGDNGGYFAAAESVGRVMSGIQINNATVVNAVNDALWIAGKSDVLSGMSDGTRWYAADNGSSVTVNGLTVVRGAASTVGNRLKMEFVSNVVVTGYIQTNASGATLTDTDPAVYIDSCRDITINGQLNAVVGVEAYSGMNLNLNLACTCPLPTTNNSNFKGINVQGVIVNATVTNAVSAGDTEIDLDAITCDIYRGMLFENGGNLFEFDETLYFDTVTAANNNNKTIAIRPAIAGISAAATIAQHNGCRNVNIQGSFNGYYYGVQAGDADPRTPRNVTVDHAAFSHNRQYDVYIRNASYSLISQSIFDRGNVRDDSSGANIRFDQTSRGLRVIGNVFEPSLSSKVAYNIHIINTTTGAVIADNSFYDQSGTHATRAAIFLAADGGASEMGHVVGDNWFASTVENMVLPATARAACGIGQNRVGFGTAAPASGAYKAGDLIWNTGPTLDSTAATAAHAAWINTTGGSPGTWGASVPMMQTGTWTPTIFGSGTAGTPTYTTQVGSYCRIGTMVFFSGQLVWSALGGAVGEMRIGGLPFTVKSSAENRGFMHPTFYDSIAIPAGTQLVGQPTNSQTYIRLMNASVTTSNDFTDEVELTSAGTLYFWGMYQI